MPVSGAHAMLLGELRCAVACAVGERDGPRSRLRQVANYRFRDVSASQHYDVACFNGYAILYCRQKAQRNQGERPATQAGLSACQPACSNRCRAKPAESRSEYTVLMRSPKSSAKLTKDLVLAEHHRVHTAGNAEQMANGVFMGVGVCESLYRFHADTTAFDEEAAQGIGPGFRVTRKPVNFHAVTSRKDESLVYDFAQAGKSVRQVAVRKRKAFANVEIGTLMV